MAAESKSSGGCPFGHGGNLASGQQATHWWPESLNLAVLNHPEEINPLGDGFDYAAAFAAVDYAALKSDIAAVLTDSKDWWPADYGTYAPFFIRLAWHAAGTYRTSDGRGGGGKGQHRFPPFRSWVDNGNLDKARKLLWPVKAKYGRSVSWADLMLLAGNVAIESMGGPTFGFGGGRPDSFAPDESANWGREEARMTDEWRRTEKRGLVPVVGNVTPMLIYVNPGSDATPLEQARDIRTTFGRMAMNDEETAALIVGGHTFGKCHGAGPGEHVGPDPDDAPLEQQGLGWKSSFGTGKGPDTITSGIEGAWTTTPAKWGNGYLESLFKYDWERHTGPGGAPQYRPKGGAGAGTVPDAHVKGKTNAPFMLSTDIALKEDPEYCKILRRWLEHPEEMGDAFSRAWFKLLHRDVHPAALVGPELPREQLVWQDPVPGAAGAPLSAADAAALKERILASGLSVRELVFTAWSAAACYRKTDQRGGANGARIRLAPQKGWAANDPEQLARVLAVLERVRGEFGKGVSLADTIVLAGSAGVEQAAKAAGHGGVEVPFTPGRTDASEEQTDADAFAVLEPTADGFRNFVGGKHEVSTEKLLLERAYMLDLTVPEMTVLLGGLRALDCNTGGSRHGVLTERPGQLTNDFFVNLLDNDLEWSAPKDGVFEGSVAGKKKWTATAADLVFGHNAQLRATCEVYGSADSSQKFVGDFVRAFAKVMDLDRFDARRN